MSLASEEYWDSFLPCLALFSAGWRIRACTHLVAKSLCVRAEGVLSVCCLSVLFQ